MTTITRGSAPWAATFDHRTGATLVGGPASCYQRVDRCDGRPGPRPNYAARRLGALGATVALALAGAWAIGVVADGVAGQPVVAAADSDAPSSPAHHVADAGDTLWSIADEHRGDVDRDRFVDALIDLNGDTSIQVGQAIRLP